VYVVVTDSCEIAGVLDNAAIVLGFVTDFSMKKVWFVFWVSVTISFIRLAITVCVATPKAHFAIAHHCCHTRPFVARSP
jgi:hypothetical protein